MIVLMIVMLGNRAKKDNLTDIVDAHFIMPLL